MSFCFFSPKNHAKALSPTQENIYDAFSSLEKETHWISCPRLGSGSTSEELTFISGVVLNCGGPLSRGPAALASLKLGVGELGGFTGSGTKRLGPPELFPEPEATLPAPAGAAVLGSFLGKEWRRGLGL